MRTEWNISSPVFLIVLTLGGCGPEPIEPPVVETPEARKFAKAFCGARQTCGCADARFASPDECERDMAKAFDTAMQKQGLTLVSDCLTSFLASDVMTECPEEPWLSQETCTVLRGTKSEGEPCEVWPELTPLTVNECTEGLSCRRGLCQSGSGSPPPTLQLGDPCSSRGGCGTPDLYCSVDGHCHPTKALGDSCDDYIACDVVTGFCNGLGSGGLGTCTARAEIGDPCSPKDWGSCDSPNFPEEFIWCDPESSTCISGYPAICRRTHAAFASRK
jgi:hypothetical protein